MILTFDKYSFFVLRYKTFHALICARDRFKLAERSCVERERSVLSLAIIETGEEHGD